MILTITDTKAVLKDTKLFKDNLVYKLSFDPAMRDDKLFKNPIVFKLSFDPALMYDDLEVRHDLADMLEQTIFDWHRKHTNLRPKKEQGCTTNSQT